MKLRRWKRQRACSGRRATDGVTIDDLVDGMGVGRPSLYSIFGDKRTLFLRVLKEVRGEPRCSVREGTFRAAHVARLGRCLPDVGRRKCDRGGICSWVSCRVYGTVGGRCRGAADLEGRGRREYRCTGVPLPRWGQRGRGTARLSSSRPRDSSARSCPGIDDARTNGAARKTLLQDAEEAAWVLLPRRARAKPEI